MGSESEHVKNFRELLQDRVMKRLEAKAEYGKRSSPSRELNESSTVANLSQVSNPSPKRSLLTNDIWDRVGERVAAKNNLVMRNCNSQSPTVGNALEIENTAVPGKVPGVSISNSTDDIKARIRAMSKVIGFASQIQDNISKHATDRAAQIVRKVSCEAKEKRLSETRVPDKRPPDQLLDLSQFGMRNLLQDASSVYEETLSQGRFMEDDYFSLPSVASTQSLFSNISEYKAFNKYLHSQSNILTDSSLVDEATEGLVGELSEDMLINYFQQLREVLHQEEADTCPTPTPDTPYFLPDTPSCTTPTPSTPPDSGLAITPTYDDITPLQSPRPFLADKGSPLSPEGSPLSPEGSPPSPEGSPLSPEGSPLSPEGSPLSPERSPLAPEGSPLSPEGSPLSPEGSPLSPEGIPLSPEGSPLSPQRHSVMVDSACQHSEEGPSCDAECQTELNQTELNQTELNQTELNQTELNQTELDHLDLSGNVTGSDQMQRNCVDSFEISVNDILSYLQPSGTPSGNHISIGTDVDNHRVLSNSNCDIQTESVNQTRLNGPQNLFDCCVQTQTSGNQTVNNQTITDNQSECTERDTDQSQCTERDTDYQSGYNEQDVPTLHIKDCLTIALSKCKLAASPPKTTKPNPSDNINEKNNEIPIRPLSLKQQMLRNLSSPSPNTKPHHPQHKQGVRSLSETGTHHLKKVHQDDMNSSVYDVRVDSSSAQVINIANVEEGANNIKVLVNLFCDTQRAVPQTISTAETTETAACSHKGHRHSGVLTCESVPTFDEGELDQLFTECHNETMRELYNELDHEFLSTTAVQRDTSSHPVVQRYILRDISRELTQNSVIRQDSDTLSCSDSDTLSASSVLNCSAPVAEQYVSHVTSLNLNQLQTSAKPLFPALSQQPLIRALNQPKTSAKPASSQPRSQIKQRTQESQTLSIPFRLIKFLPVEPDSFINRTFAHDGISKDDINPMCKSIQVNFERNPSLSNQEELSILDRETQLEAQRIALLQQQRAQPEHFL